MAEPGPGPAGASGLPLPRLLHPVRTIGRRRYDFDRQVAVMAVVNRTPDSFHDRGSTFALDRAVEAALLAVDEGADWVDVGGVPFAPGPEVSGRDELARVLPVVEALVDRTDVVVSVDTMRADVAEAVLAAGAAVVNDTSGLADPRLAGVVADAGATLVVTHSLAPPRQPHPLPRYDDVVTEVVDALRRRVDAALDAGVAEDRLVVDPGHDLHKTTVHTLELTRRLAEVAALGHPVLAAVSNKDFVGEALGRPRGARLAGSLSAAVTSVLLGARIVRMHDVRASVDAVRMVEAVLGWRDPLEARHNVEPVARTQEDA